jgi:hypothetical protein
MGDRPEHLLPRCTNCWTVRTNVPETPPCPPTARQSGGLDLSERYTGAGAVWPRSSQFDNSSAGGPPSGRSRSYSVWSLHTPDAVPPANQSVEVGNSDAGKPRGLRGPIVAYCCSFLDGVRPWRASVRPSSSTARSGVFSRRRWAACGRVTGGQPRDVQVQPLAQVQGGFIQRQLGRSHPQVQGIAVGAAAEALPTMPLQVGGERTNGCAACVNHGRDMARAPGHQSLCWARSQAAPTLGPTAAAGAGQRNRFQPLWVSRVAVQRRGTRTGSRHCPRNRWRAKASWRRSMR